MCVHGCNQVKIEACFTGADDERAAVLYQANQNVCMGKTFCQENSRLVESYSKVSFLEPSFCFHLSAYGRSWNINLWDFLTFVFSFVLSFLFSVIIIIYGFHPAHCYTALHFFKKIPVCLLSVSSPGIHPFWIHWVPTIHSFSLILHHQLMC